MRRVIIESPYAGDVERNKRYLRAAMRDCLMRGEAPFASHAIYTQPGVLRDDVPEERERGMAAGWAWTVIADAVVVYEDLGISAGMKRGIEAAHGVPIEYRSLPEWVTGYQIIDGPNGTKIELVDGGFSFELKMHTGPCDHRHHHIRWSTWRQCGTCGEEISRAEVSDVDVVFT